MRARLARWLVRASWALAAAVLVWLLALSGTDTGSAILFATTVALAGGAASCAGRAIAAATAGDVLLWTGRALALTGAAVAVSFPATIYQEIAMLTAEGRPLTYDMGRAFWYEVGIMPLTVVPALVALRWPRPGGALFLVAAALGMVLALGRPFGVIYPEASGGVLADVLSLLPPLVTALFLLLGAAVRRPLRTAA